MQIANLNELILKTLDDYKALDILQLDVTELTNVTDTMIIASGSSKRHLTALADYLIEAVKASGLLPLGVEGRNHAEWVLVDLNDTVVHLMLPETRQHYDLERLWSDLPLNRSDMQG